MFYALYSLTTSAICTRVEASNQQDEDAAGELLQCQLYYNG